MERIPQYTHIYEDLSPKETSSYARNEGRFRPTIKTQSPQKSRYA